MHFKLLTMGLLTAITTGILSGCGQQSLATNRPIAFDQTSFQTNQTNRYQTQLNHYSRQVTKDHNFTNQFKTTTDTTDYDQIKANVNAFSLPANLADDSTMGSEIMALQLLHQNPSEFDLKTLLKQNNQLSTKNIQSTIKTFPKHVQAFNWTTVAYANAANYFKKHLNTHQLVTQQVSAYLTKQNFTNDQINAVLNQLVEHQKSDSNLNGNVLNQRIPAKDAQNITLATNFTQAYLTTPRSKNDLYAHLINTNGFDEKTVDQVVQKLNLDWNLLARLVAIHNQNQQPSNRKYNAIQLANSVIDQHFTKQQALYAANHVSNTSKEQNEINAAVARLNQKETETQKALDAENKRKDALNHLKRTSTTQRKYDQYAYQKLMNPYWQAYQTAYNHHQNMQKFRNKTYPTNHNYDKALVVARYWTSQIDQSNHVDPQVLHSILTNQTNYYHFNESIANRAIKQANQEYQINWIQRGKALIKNQRSYLTKAQLADELQSYGFTDEQIQQII